MRCGCACCGGWCRRGDGFGPVDVGSLVRLFGYRIVGTRRHPQPAARTSSAAQINATGSTRRPRQNRGNKVCERPHPPTSEKVARRGRIRRNDPAASRTNHRAAGHGANRAPQPGHANSPDSSCLWRASHFRECGPNKVRSGKDEGSWRRNTRNSLPSFVRKQRSWWWMGSGRSQRSLADMG